MSQQPNDDEPIGTHLGDGRYEIPLSELTEVTYFRPGMPAPLQGDEPQEDLAPHEPLQETTELTPSDIVIFYDRFSMNPLSEGCNQWAFVVDSNRALFHRWFVHSIKLSKLRKKTTAIRITRIPRSMADSVASFLIKCRWRPALFRAAINHLQCDNYIPFLTGSFYPPELKYHDENEYELQWQHMLEQMEPHDILLTFDRTSWLSRLIAVTTHGPFSHVAHYIGDGQIWEIVTSGARVVPIETYKGRERYRVAIYRHNGYEEMPREQQLEALLAMIGNVKYDYFGAIVAGIKTLFGWHRESMSPNGIILGGPFLFISQA